MRRIKARIPKERGIKYQFFGSKLNYLLTVYEMLINLFAPRELKESDAQDFTPKPGIDNWTKVGDYQRVINENGVNFRIHQF